MAAPALQLDFCDLLGRGRRRHDHHKRQPEETGKVRFGNGRRTVDASTTVRPPHSQPLHNAERRQEVRQTRLETAGRMTGPVLETQVHRRKRGQVQGNQAGVAGAPKTRFDAANGGPQPDSLAAARSLTSDRQSIASPDAVGRSKRRVCQRRSRGRCALPFFALNYTKLLGYHVQEL